MNHIKSGYWEEEGWRVKVRATILWILRERKIELTSKYENPCRKVHWNMIIIKGMLKIRKKRGSIVRNSIYCHYLGSALQVIIKTYFGVKTQREKNSPKFFFYVWYNTKCSVSDHNLSDISSTTLRLPLLSVKIFLSKHETAYCYVFLLRFFFSNNAPPPSLVLVIFNFSAVTSFVILWWVSQSTKSSFRQLNMNSRM